MYLSKLRIWNFRRYSMIGDTFDTAKPGIEVGDCCVKRNDYGCF